MAVDQAGKSWALTPISYSETQCQVSFVFDQPLPPGQYTLRLPATGGLTDLAGKAPVAPGLSPGVLASWTVAARRSPSIPNDLGVLWPSLVDGVSRTSTIAAGTDRRLSRRDSRLRPQQSGDHPSRRVSLAIRRVGGDGVTALERGSDTPLSDYLMDLRAGVYWFAFTAVGSQPVQVRVDPQVAASRPRIAGRQRRGPVARAQLEAVESLLVKSDERFPGRTGDHARRKYCESAGRSDFGLGGSVRFLRACWSR